jgi:hypothetical protein
MATGKLKDVGVGGLFSFSKKGAVHMVSRIGLVHIEFKSYNDGKIRTAPINRDMPVHRRPEMDKYFCAKWFKEN